MKKITTLTLLLLLFNNSYSQETKDNINYLGRNKTRIPPDNAINVNASSTYPQFQDVKRGVCIFHFPKRPETPGHKLISTGTIINTIENSHTGHGDRTTLLLCAAHNIIGHDFALNKNAFKVGDDLIFYMSFDNESPLGEEPGGDYDRYIDQLSQMLIHRLWKTNVKVLVLDLESDIALLEVKFGMEDGEPSLEQHLAFLNTYAVGWTLHPNLYNDQCFASQLLKI